MDLDHAVTNGVKPASVNNIRNGTSRSETISAVSKSRQAAPQFLAVGAKNLLLISFGCTLGFSTILIPELQKPQPEIEVSLEELSWISSINLILVPVGCLGSGIVSSYLGRKRTMMLATGPFICAWFLYHYAHNSTMLLCALAMTGLTGGLLEAPVLTYVAEISQPHLRGMLSATSTMSVITGIFLQMLAGSLTTWRTVALINIALPTLCFICLCLVPESPHWLIAKGRLDEALRSLRWLRGWVSAAQVQEEYNSVCESIQKPPGQETLGVEKYWTHFMKRSFLLPFFIVGWGFFVGTFGGMAPLQTFAVSIFNQLDTPIEKYTATVIMGAAEFLGTLSCVILIHFTGKRKLALVSTVSTALCFFIAAVYKFMMDRGTIVDSTYSWIPTYILIGSAYLSHLSIRVLPWILIGEVFPSKVRSAAAGAASSFSYVCTFIVNKVYLYMEQGITLAGSFWFYSAVGIMGAIVIYFVLPETEGRTLREIEEHFAGIQNLKERPKKEEFAFKEKWAASNPTLVVANDVESKL